MSSGRLRRRRQIRTGCCRRSAKQSDNSIEFLLRRRSSVSGRIEAFSALPRASAAVPVQVIGTNAPPTPFSVCARRTEVRCPLSSNGRANFANRISLILCKLLQQLQVGTNDCRQLSRGPLRYQRPRDLVVRANPHFVARWRSGTSRSLCSTHFSSVSNSTFGMIGLAM